MLDLDRQAGSGMRPRCGCLWTDGGLGDGTRQVPRLWTYLSGAFVSNTSTR